MIIPNGLHYNIYVIVVLWSFKVYGSSHSEYHYITLKGTTHTPDLYYAIYGTMSVVILLGPSQLSALWNSKVSAFKGGLFVCKTMEMACWTKQSVCIIVDVCISGVSARRGSCMYSPILIHGLLWTGSVVFTVDTENLSKPGNGHLFELSIELL